MDNYINLHESSYTAYAQDYQDVKEGCKDPNIRATLKERSEDIGIDVGFFHRITKIFYSFDIQWVGLSWEAPIGGALLAYDCQGNLLSIQKTGGIKSIQFFNSPDKTSPSIIMEEFGSGSGYRSNSLAIYSLHDKKIVTQWEHIINETVSGFPGVDNFVESYELSKSDNLKGTGWRKLSLVGVRKSYQPDGTKLREEKLPPENYCWSDEKKIYSLCK